LTHFSQLWSDEIEVTRVECGENVRVKLKGVEENDISSGFVLCDPNNPIKSCKIFDAQVRNFSEFLNSDQILNFDIGDTIGLSHLPKCTFITHRVLKFIANWGSYILDVVIIVLAFAFGANSDALTPVLRYFSECQVAECKISKILPKTIFSNNQISELINVRTDKFSN
jgi:hypothetical protein